MAFKHRSFSLNIWTSRFGATKIPPSRPLPEPLRDPGLARKRLKKPENPPFPTTSGAIAWPRPCSERVQFSVFERSGWFSRKKSRSWSPPEPLRDPGLAQKVFRRWKSLFSSNVFNFVDFSWHFCDFPKVPIEDFPLPPHFWPLPEPLRDPGLARNVDFHKKIADFHEQLQTSTCSRREAANFGTCII